MTRLTRHSLYGSLPGLRRALVCLALLTLTAAGARAQVSVTTSPTDGRTPSGLKTGAGTVNPYNGDLTFTVPLLAVAGRGEAGYGVVAPIQQKWVVRHTSSIAQCFNSPHCSGPVHFYNALFNWRDGLQPGFSPGVMQARRVGGFDFATPVQNGTEGIGRHFIPIDTSYDAQRPVSTRNTLTRLTFTAGDGSELELVDQNTGGQPNSQACTSETPGFNRGRTFVSRDGSATTFVADADVRDLACNQAGTMGSFSNSQPLAVSGYLYTRNGSVYRFDGGRVSWMRDRNGNRLLFTYDAGGNLVEVKDSLERQVTFSYVGNYTQITYKGFAQQERAVKIYHDYLGSLLRPNSGYALKTIPDLFPSLSGDSSQPANFNPYLVSAIELPNQQFYHFYYNPYGELARVELPTGGAIEYDFAAGIDASGFDPQTGISSGLLKSGDEINIYRRVIEERVYAGGGTGSAYTGKTTYSRKSETWTQSAGGGMTLTSTANDGFVNVDSYAPGGARLARVRHYYRGSPQDSILQSIQNPSGYSYWDEGRQYKTELFDADGSTLLRRVEQQWEQRAPVSWWASFCSAAGSSYCGSNPVAVEPPNDVRLTRSTVTLADTNQVSRQEFAYDGFNNPTDTKTYDYGAGAPGPLLRHDHTDYLTVNPVNNIDYTSASASSPHLRALVTNQYVYGVNPATGIEVLQARTHYDYDQNALTERPGITGGCTYYPNGQCSATGQGGEASAQYATRGNVTAVTRYTDAQAGTGALTTAASYDVAGNVVSTTDARGLTSYTSYNDNFSDGNNARATFAFQTGTTSPVPDPSGGYASNTALTASQVYDYSTGLVTSSTDANGKVTTSEYNDIFDRPTKVTRPDGGSTSYEYGDTPGNLYVRTQTLQQSTPTQQMLEDYQLFDGLGRQYRSLRRDNQDASNPWLTSDTQYDAMGRVWRVSNPYRSAGAVGTVNPSGRWTTNAYDALGRILTVTTPDSAVVSTSYSGSSMTVADQHASGTAGRARTSKVDALGRLAQVVEDPNGAAFQTNYTYDALGNLRRVAQDTPSQQQRRYFMYDSLSRLVRAKNPEQDNLTPDTDFPARTDSISGAANSDWSVAYSYDADGNLAARKDARNVKTTYAYDNLNRNTTVTYLIGTDSTLGVERHYDGALNGRGRLHWSRAGSSQTGINEYDAMGRVLEQHQNFLSGGAWSADYSVRHAYDLAGNVLTQTYPSGRTVTYHYDAAGRPDSFSGDIGDGVQRAYAANITYDETGALREEQFGTQVPLYRKLHRNVRGQVYDIRLGTQPWAANEWSWNRGALLNYYSSNYQWGVDGGSDDNGNLLRSTYFIPADDQTSSYSVISTDYAYDAMNRLSSVTEYQNGITPTFSQSYLYDRWGNRTINQDTTKTWGAVPKPAFQVDSATNRLGVPAGQPGVMSYDNAGNLVNDTYTSYGSRAYDAENRMTSAQDAWQGWSYYTYDADGRRVRRSTHGAEVWQVYGMDGELLSEYRAGAATFIPTKEYGYRSGELLVTVSSGDEQRLTRFVQNLYYGALQRDPTAQESQDGKNQLAAAGAQGLTQLTAAAQQAARSLFLSTNYETANGRTDAQYVTDLYYAYLQRGPDDGGLAWWVGQVQQTGRANVCTAFEASGEFLTLAQTLYGSSVAGDNQRTERFVRNFYLAAYGREPNATELADETGRLNSAAAQGQSQVQAEAEAMGRRLFAAQVTMPASTLPTRDYVTNLYEGFLQRGPDSGGLDFWTSQAAGGATNRQNVLNAFAVSGAFRDLAATLYREARWLVSDHLGTPRMVVDKSGSLASVKRHDYLPFGEEIGGDVGGRTTLRGYNQVDNVRQGFTKYERDDETGLDYAQARYYSKAQGRFTGVDPANAGADPGDPQSWNGYAYAGNNPLLYTDPSGRTYLIRHADGSTELMTDAQFDQMKKNPANAELGVIVENGNIYNRNENGDLVSVGTYERVAFDDLTDDANTVIFRLARFGPAMQKTILAFTAANLAPAVIITGSGALVGVGTQTLGLSEAGASLATEGALSGLSLQQLNSLIRGNQVQLLRKLFGRGIEGAERALASGEVPAGLTKESLLVYREIARRTIARGVDTGVQALRLKVIEEALKKIK